MVLLPLWSVFVASTSWPVHRKPSTVASTLSLAPNKTWRAVRRLSRVLSTPSPAVHTF